ncbi:MAG: hypothetical protein AAFY71_19865 [Bacteroidota bacterium]
MNQFLWFIAGAIAAFITNLITPPIYSWARKKLARRILRYQSKRSNLIILGPNPSNQRMKIGSLELDFIVLQYARYSPDLIYTTYKDRAISLNSDFKRMKDEFIQDLKKRQRKGELGLPYNSAMYKLSSFNVGEREIVDGEEIPILKLNFLPTDYFTQIITDLNVGNPTREKYAKSVDLTIQPVPEFSSILGVNFNIITSDGYLIVTQRSSEVNVNGGRYHTSVGENLLRPTDSDPKGAPDLFYCARRGIQEELGLSVDAKDIEFTIFGVYPPWCQYKIIGWSKIKETKSEVLEIHSLAIPKDKWENNKLLFVPCNPKSIAKFLKETDRHNWYDIGIACLIFSLFQVGYSHKEISKAFL